MKTFKELRKILAVFLALSFVFLALYAYNKNKSYTALHTMFLQEKKELQTHLNLMIKDYTDVVVRKKKISKRLHKELLKMKNLRDSITMLKNDNFDLIRRYRKKIATLERENRNLFIRIDSLNEANQLLAQEKVMAAEIIQQKETINIALAKKYTTLETQQQKLKQKVAIASVIKISPITAMAMKEKSNGKLTSTSRSSRTDAFKVNFDLLKNPVTTPGKKTVHIQIVNENKKVVHPKGKTKLKNGAVIQYSDLLKVDYTNEKLSLVSFVLVNRNIITKGNYTISTFVDGNYTGNSIVKLR